MKKRITVSLAFVLSFCFAASIFAQTTKPTSKPASTQSVFAAAGSPKTIEFKVASYNILRGEQEADVLKNIRSVKPDLVFLQEAPKDVVKYFAEKFKMSYNFGPYYPNESTGLGILTRGTLKPVKLFTMKGERNFALGSKVTLDGETFLAVCVHLKSLPRPVTKGVFEVMEPHTRQAERILAEVSKQDLPALVGGDCNMLAFSPEYVKLTSRLTDVASKSPNICQPTIFVHDMGYRIDYFFTRGSWQVLDYGVSPKPGSDHRMIHAQLKLERR